MSDDTSRVYTPKGKVAHLTEQGTITLCRLWYPDGFLGTGSQEEYETAATMPTCKTCYIKDGGA